MKQAAGEANITIIAIILIGLLAALAAILIPRLASNSIYTTCCTEAGGVWSKGYCVANTPISCEERESVWKEYDKCVIESNKHNANEKYRAVECSN